MNCLWIARDLPFPADAGDRIYSGQLAGALADAGATVRFIGFPTVGGELPAASPVDWLPVPGAKHSQRSALLNTLPVAAAIHDTAAYRNVLDAQLHDAWDAIVFDSYGSGWALKRYLAGHRAAQQPPPVLVHVAHNQEGVLWQDMARHSRVGPLKKIALWQNWLKVRALERFVLRHADLTTAISSEDAAALGTLTRGRPIVELTPGYSGLRRPARVIAADCPRRVVLIGSFRWVVKQENLRRFIALADETFHRHGIVFEVIGDVPESLLAELKPRVKATVFHGFVDDVAPFFNRARMAVVPEAIGGGFKLKLLDYIFSRVPVATVAAAAAGLPAEIRNNLLNCPDLGALVAAIVLYIDRLDALNIMQQRAYEAAARLFDWRDRGTALRDAIAACRQGQVGVPRARPESGYRMRPS